MADRTTGIVIVDHGSLRSESNEMLLQAVRKFARRTRYAIIEPAHMELADPDINAAFTRCVEQGATHVVVFPYFLSPGRHWTQDIPQLTAAAAEQHPGVSWQVTPPFGLHDGMMDIMQDRIDAALAEQSQD